MEKNTIFYILGALVVIYLLIAMTNRKKANSRRDRKFMGEYKRKDDRK